MLFVLNFLAVLILMLVTGVFWGPWFALSRSFKLFSAEEFIKIAKVMSTNLGVPMRFMLPCCIVLLLASVYIYPDKSSPGFYFDIVALALITVSLIVTIWVEVPIVKNVEQWTETILPANWMAIRSRWVSFHRIRTFASVISFACLIISILYMVKL